MKKRKARVVQIKPELWFRFPSGKRSWSFTLYIAHPCGKLEGFYDKTVLGSKAFPSWDIPYFKRDDVVNSCIWEFITEI